MANSNPCLRKALGPDGRVLAIEERFWNRLEFFAPQPLSELMGGRRRGVSARIRKSSSLDKKSVRDIAGHLKRAKELRENGQLGGAASEMERAAEIGRRGPEFKQYLADILPDLAALYVITGDIDKAYGVLEEARTLSALSDTLSVIILSNQAASYVYKGEAAKARPLLLEAVEIYRRAEPLDRVDLARTLTNLSVVCTELGLKEQAHAHCGEAYDLLNTAAHASDPLMANVMHNWGFAHKQAGRWNGALYCFRRAEELLKTHGDERALDRATVLYENAQLHEWMRRPEDGFSMASEAMEIRANVLGAVHEDVAQAAQLAGRLQLQIREFPDAVSYLEKAFQIYNQLYGFIGERTFRVWHDLLTTVWRAGGHEAAILELKKVLPIYRSVGSKGNPYLFRALADLAGALEIDAKDEEMRQTAREAWDLVATLPEEFDEGLAPYYDNLAGLLVRLGKGAQAVPILRRAFLTSDPLIHQAVTTRDDLLRRHCIRQLAAETVRFIDVVAEHAPADPDAVAAAFYFVVNRKGLRAETAMARDDRRLARAEPELAPLLEQVHEVEQKLLDLEGGGFYDGVRKMLWQKGDLEDELQFLNGEIEARSDWDNLPQLRLPVNARAEEIASALPPASALVEYYALTFPKHDRVREMLAKFGDEEWLGSEVGADQYVAFVVRDGHPVQFFDLGGGTDIDNLAKSYLAALAGKEPSEESLSRELRKKLFDPLAGALDGYPTVIIAPDGAVCRIPFGVLLAEDGARLVNRFTFSYVITGRTLLGFGRGELELQEPLVVGDPDYDYSKPGTSKEPPEPVEGFQDFFFARLEGTADEAWRVSERIGGLRLTRKKATETAVRDCHSPAILHLATHGYYIPRFAGRFLVVGDWRKSGFGGYMRREVLGRASNPLLRSGIVLAGVNAWSAGETLPDEVGDGLLNSAEVAQLDLKNTELVVLSACSTALGDVRAGDGVAGLLYGFQIAGARTTVASLWQIPDEATGDLMDAFYEAILKGVPRVDALRDAQLKLLNAQRPVWEWGSYVCYGEPFPIRYRPTY